MANPSCFKCSMTGQGGGGGGEGGGDGLETSQPLLYIIIGKRNNTGFLSKNIFIYIFYC